VRRIHAKSVRLARLVVRYGRVKHITVRALARLVAVRVFVKGCVNLRHVKQTVKSTPVSRGVRFGRVRFRRVRGIARQDVRTLLVRVCAKATVSLVVVNTTARQDPVKGMAPVRRLAVKSTIARPIPARGGVPWDTAKGGVSRMSVKWGANLTVK